MKNKLIHFSALFAIFLLIVSLFLCTASATKNTDKKLKDSEVVIKDNKTTHKSKVVATVDSTDESVEDVVDSTDESVEDDNESITDLEDSNGSSSPVLRSNVNVEIFHDKAGPFKMGDTVNITATFDEPVQSVELTVSDDISSPYDMINLDDNVWYYEYTVPDSVDGAVDLTISATDSKEKTVEKTDIGAFVIDNTAPDVTGLEPDQFTNMNNVLFNFSASDELSKNMSYTLYINGIEKDTGMIVNGGYKQSEFTLDDGNYTWEVEVKDEVGNIGTSGVADLYVDTEAPVLTLFSPEDHFVNTDGIVNFNFTADDAFTAKYENLNLSYEVYIDDELVEGEGSGTMRPGEFIQIQNNTLSEGSHSWSVTITDEADNNVTSEDQDFDVNTKGLKVSLVSPKDEYVHSKPVFKFRVAGGTGLPFDYVLLINGEKVENSTCDGNEDKTLTVDEEAVSNYSVSAAIADGEDMTWTVNITDSAGNTYEPQPYHFSLDTTPPERVSNLKVVDTPSETEWSYTRNYPGLFASWDANTEEDLDSTPYDVFISDFKPNSIKDMEKVKSTSELYSYIREYGGKPLVYGKDYWVAVIARDKVGNFNNYFTAICGPVQTYEDMKITLDPGWNIKSVPKRLLESNTSPESVFGNGSKVLYWNGKCWESPQTIEPCKGYWVYSPKAFENDIKFKENFSDSAAPDKPASLNLTPGWHMIGPTSLQPATWSAILFSLENSLKDYKFSNLVTYSSHEGWSGLVPELGLIDTINGNESAVPARNLIYKSDPRPVGVLQYQGLMVPGQGYWIYIKEEGTYEPNVSINNRNSDDTNGIIDEGPDDDKLTDDKTDDEVPIDDTLTDDEPDDDVPIDDTLTNDETADS
jgi:hypothetical protein